MVDVEGAELVDERALVDQARTDPEAFARLYRHYLPRIHAFCARRSGSRDVADDVTAITFERALRGLGSFEWQSGGFSAWLYRIAANELVDHHRAGRRVSGRSSRGPGWLPARSPSRMISPSTTGCAGRSTRSAPGTSGC